MNKEDITFVLPLFRPNKYEIDNLKFCINKIKDCRIIVVEQVIRHRKSKIEDICNKLGILYIQHQLYLDNINKPSMLKSVLPLVKSEYIWFHDPNIYVKFSDILLKIEKNKETRQILASLKKINLEDTKKIKNNKTINIKFLKPDSLVGNILETSCIINTQQLLKSWNLSLNRNIQHINQYGIYLYNNKKNNNNIYICVNNHVRKKISDDDSVDLQRQIIESIKKEPLLEDNIKISTGRNLIYYTLFDSGHSYVKMLKLSIDSLLKNMKDPFDVVVFTDESTKKKINRQINHRIDFVIMPTPIDGIEASKIKTKIYSYKNIDNYENILFIDADVVFLKEIKDLFNNIKYDILYTAFNDNLRFSFLYDHICHGLGEIFSDQDKEKMMKKNQFPFNAGQFMFKNSALMKYHFDRLNKFMEEWPGPHFFEQSFLNVYFCINLITNTLLNEFVQFNAIDSNCVLNDKPMVHFLGDALNGQSKLNYIEKCLI